MEPREPRLYRDDAGAALERVHRLEEENQLLRAEIEQIKAGRADPVPPPYRAAAMALCIASIAVGAALAFSSPAELPGVPEVTLTLFNAPEPPVDPAVADCSIPYWYDAQNVKHYKPSCFTR